jgi:hypothetical protein
MTLRFSQSFSLSMATPSMLLPGARCKALTDKSKTPRAPCFSVCSVVSLLLDLFAGTSEKAHFGVEFARVGGVEPYLASAFLQDCQYVLPAGR